MVIENGVKILTSIRVGTYLGWRDFEEEDGTAKRDGALKEILERPCKKEINDVYLEWIFLCIFVFLLGEGWGTIYREFRGRKKRKDGIWALMGVLIPNFFVIYVFGRVLRFYS